MEEKRAGTIFINLIEDEQRGKHASLQIFLNRTSQGRKIGRAAYQAACFASQYNEIYAHMRKSNTASKKAALYAGFEDATTSADTQLVMRWNRATASRD
ncbi:GNAT family N-acetyltransferase [Pseudomonas chlororaphis]|uniref:GNAT family N-acetyltransferase n=1 Tax=Pseudomonas chlororaphis TaxID=587753 RepID=UPI0018E9DE19|nr:GNAT family protein [Pseudomonas chlororaphis]